MDILDLTSKNPFSDWVKKEVAVNRRNVNIIISGKTQLRKSTIALKLAILIQNDFDMSTQMGIIKADEYLKVLNIKGKRGDVMVLDEFGVGMDHHSWHSFLNKAMNYVMQTYGHEGKIVIVTAPYMDYVDSDAKKLFDININILKKDDRNRCVIAKIEILQYNQKLKKMYTRFFRGKLADGHIKKIDAWKIGYPDKELLKQYFAIANVSKEFLKSDLASEAVHITKMGKRARFDVDKAIDEIIANPDKFISSYGLRKFIPLPVIKDHFKIGKHLATDVKTLAEARLDIGFHKEPNADGAA